MFFAANANLLIHPYLLGGVRILSPAGFLWSLLFAGLLIVLPFLAVRIGRFGESTAFTPGEWVLTAFLAALVFGFSRTVLTTWPAGYGRVAAAWGLLALSLPVILAFHEVGRVRRWTGVGPALFFMLLLAWPLPHLIRDHGPAVSPPTAPASSRPVILVSLDTTRPDHLSFFGYPKATSPHLDAFLRKCLVFPRAYGTSSWTLPSHASVYTGLYPVTHGAHYPPGARSGGLPGSLDPGLPTLAAIFRERGYRTAAIAANRLAVSPEFGLDRGFEHVDHSLRADTRPIPVNLLRAAGRLLRRNGLTRFTRLHRDAREITDAALTWTRRHRREPFFLFVNYMDPHTPYAPPRPLHGDPGSETLFRRLRWLWSATKKSGPSAVRNYDAEIRYMDDHLERFLDGLEHQGILDRAILVIFSDHGESHGELGQWGHGKEVHEAVLRVLLAIHTPEEAHTGLDSTFVNLADVPRLIAALDGKERAAAVLGLRRGPWVAGEKFLTHHESGRDRRFDHPTRLIAARLGRFKLVSADGDTARLYDVTLDPGETADLSALYPDTTRLLEDYVAAWAEARRGTRPQRATAARGNALEVLRGLGYVQ